MSQRPQPPPASALPDTDPKPVAAFAAMSAKGHAKRLAARKAAAEAAADADVEAWLAEQDSQPSQVFY